MSIDTAKGETTAAELSRARRQAARRAAESAATIPQFTVSAELPVTGAPHPTDAVIRACALALREQPAVNGAYRDGRAERYGRINVGVTVTVEDGTLVPTIFDADRKEVAEIAAERERLAAEARAGTIAPPDLAGATFTVVDLAGPDVAFATTLVVPGQGAALSIAGPRQGALGATLACDHRLLDQRAAAAFLARVGELL